MSVTWKDIKYTTLQKMFSITGASKEIPNDSASMEYINAMPQACNEALQLLSTAGKFIIKEFQYLNFPMENLLGKDLFKTYTVVNDSIEFKADGAKSYYFQISGLPLSCKLYVGGAVNKDFAVESSGKFTVIKGNIVFTGEETDTTVKIVVTAKSPVYMKNMCFYDCSFETDAEVPQYEKFIKIDLTEELDDFYQLAPAELYKVEADDYIVADDYFQEVDKTLMIPRDKPGLYLIHYRAYPQQITLNTLDSTELALDPEVAALIPLYIASQLYKDDDNAISTTYRNEFEVGRDALNQGPLLPKREKFESASGWC